MSKSIDDKMEKKASGYKLVGCIIDEEMKTNVNMIFFPRKNIFRWKIT